MSDPKNPWGPRKGDDKPGPSQPESIWTKNRKNPADEIIDQLQDRLKKMMGGGGGDDNHHARNQGIGFLALLGLVAVVIWMGTGFFRVQEGDVGVVLRFGKMVRIVGPGLRYHFPSPFEDATVQKVSAVNRIDGGVSSDSKSDTEQALTLTADENMVIIGYSLQWRIKDVGDFLFTARDPEGLIIVAAESAMREIVGQTQARMVLAEGRVGIQTRTQELIQKLLDAYKLGVEIVNFQLQQVQAPPQVIDSYNDVQASRVDADRLKNEAESYRNQIVPVAKGNAEKKLQDIQANAQKIIAEAEGEIGRFSRVYAAYVDNKSVVTARNYMNTMERVLKASPKIILDPKMGKDLVPYLPVNEMKRKQLENDQSPESVTDLKVEKK